MKTYLVKIESSLSFVRREFTLLRAIILMFIFTSLAPMSAQVTIETPYSGGSAWDNGFITFSVENTNNFAVSIDEVMHRHNVNSNGASYFLWYTDTDLSGRPNISATNGWRMIGKSPPISGSTGNVPILTDLNFILPANTTYRFAVSGTPGVNLAYSPATDTPSVFTRRGVVLTTNVQDIGTAGTFPGTEGSFFTPRAWNGGFTFDTASACLSSPVAGVAGASYTQLCEGSVAHLFLEEGSPSMGQTYQWQISTDSVSFSNIPNATARYTSVEMSITSWYRAIVTCGGVSDTSEPVRVDVSGIVFDGSYTIDQTQPASETNFTSFNELANNFSCGIVGPTEVEVVQGSGPYNEQVTFGQLFGASSVNTLTIKGNGEVIEFQTDQSADRAVIRLDGSAYIILDSLNIISSDDTYGWGIHMTNGAHNNIIRNCEIDVSAVTNTGISNGAGIVASNTNTSATSVGDNANNNIIENNRILGNATGGGYHGIVIYGNTTGGSTGNIIRNNEISDFYVSGIRLNNASHSIVEGNILSRPNRTNHTTLRPMYVSAGSEGSHIRSNTVTRLFGSAATSIVYAFSIGGAGTQDDPIHVYNNKVYNIYGGGTYYLLYNASPWTNYYHNTIVADDTLASTSATYGFYTTTATNDNIEVFNNIFYMARNTSSTLNYAIRVNTPDVTNFKSDNNILFLDNGASVGYRSSGYQSLSDWFDNTGDDQNSVILDPQFVSRFDGDLEPTNASVAGIGRDVLSIVESDVRGVPRQAAGTPGAYHIDLPSGADPKFVRFLSPTPGTCDSADVIVELVNLGNDDITSLTINWSVNGTTQPSVTVTDTFFGGSFKEVNLGQFPIAPASSNDIDVSITASTPADINTGNNDGSVEGFRPAMNGNYTINGNNPTTGTNFNSFNDFAQELQDLGVCGPIVAEVVSGSGPYEEVVEFQDIEGVSSTNTITINGNGELITFNNLAATRAMIRINGVSHMVIDSLQFESQNNLYGWGVHLTNQADSNVIRNCHFDISSVTSVTQSNSAGIVLSGSNTVVTTAGSGSYNLFENNYIVGDTTGGPYQGIIISGGGDNTIGNVIRNNTITNFHLHGVSINNTVNTIIDNNNISRPARTGSGTIRGIYINTGTADGLIVSNNEIYRLNTNITSSTSIVSYIYNSGAVSENAPVYIYNNLMYRMDGGGTQYGMYNAAAWSNYYHNTVILADSTSATQATYGFYTTTLANDNLEVYNNIFYMARQTTGLQYAIRVNTATLTNFNSDNNMYFLGTDAGVGFRSTGFNTIEDWFAATGDDANSRIDNPMFTSVSNDNYRTGNFWLLLLGRDLSSFVTEDIEGDPRIQPSSPGAYQMQPVVGSDPALLSFAKPELGNCGGNSEVSILATNFGEDYVPSVTIEWSVNGTPQTPVTFTDTLFSTEVVEISLGQVNIQSAQMYDFEARIVSSSPADVNTDNNEIEYENFRTGFEGTYTLNSFGSSTPTNFVSFSDLAFQLNTYGVCGAVTINVEPVTGPYEEQVVFSEIINSSSTNPIIINGNGNIIRYEATSSETRPTVILNGTDHLTLDSLIIEATGSSWGWGIWMGNNADSNTIRSSEIRTSLTITSANSAGIVISENTTSATAYGNTGSYNVIENNYIQGGYYGVAMSGIASNDNVSGNKILNNTIEDFRYYGLYVRAQNDCEIYGNDIFRSVRDNFTLTYGIFLTAGLTNSRVENNTIHDFDGTNPGQNSTSYGISLTVLNGGANEKSVISNNKVYNIDGSQGILYGIHTSNANNVQIFHNTVAIVGDTTGTTGAAFYSTSNANGTEVRNNIFYIRRPSGSNNYGVYLNTATTAIQMSHNVYSIDEDHSNSYIGYYDGDQFSNINSWRNINGGAFDQNSVAADPLFKDLANGDVEPSAAQIKGMGINLSSIVQEDYFGAIRPSSPDPGAIQFVPQPCSGAYNLLEDSVQIVPNVAGNSFISWESTANRWVVEWGPCGFSPGSGLGISIDSAVTNNESYMIPNIPMNECYCVFIQEDCDSLFGTWAGPIEVCADTDFDVEIIEIVKPVDEDCGLSLMDFKVVIQNNGLVTPDSIEINMIVSGDYNRTFTTIYRGNLQRNEIDTITVGNINTYLGGVVDISASVRLVNDQDTRNDSISVQDVNIITMDILGFESVHISDFEYNFISNRPDADTIIWNIDGQEIIGDTVYYDFIEMDSVEVCMTVFSHCNPGQVCKMLYRYDLGTTDFGAGNLNVFPNPTAGRFTVDFANTISGEVSLQLLDMQGNQIMNEIMNGFSGNYHKEFDFSHLASGVYTLRMQGPEGVANKRVIIQK